MQFLAGFSVFSHFYSRNVIYTLYFSYIVQHLSLSRVETPLLTPSSYGITQLDCETLPSHIGHFTDAKTTARL